VVDKDIAIKGTPASSAPSSNEMVNGASSPSMAAKTGKMAGGRGGKKSSFERVLDMLVPLYPTYTR